jgi:hypothetical protein
MVGEKAPMLGRTCRLDTSAVVAGPGLSMAFLRAPRPGASRPADDSTPDAEPR